MVIPPSTGPLADPPAPGPLTRDLPPACAHPFCDDDAGHDGPPLPVGAGMTQADALARFLDARLDEEEAEARETADADAEFWADVKGDGTYFAMHHPDRMLREVEAKRQIVTRYEFACRQAVVNVGAERESWEKIAGALERDVLALATVYNGWPPGLLEVTDATEHS
jgi:Family of unknown function (DUF6221)